MPDVRRTQPYHFGDIYVAMTSLNRTSTYKCVRVPETQAEMGEHA